MAVSALPPRRAFKDNPAFSLYRKFLAHIKECRISTKRTEKRSMIALNEENLKKKMSAKKHQKTANAEAKKEKTLTMQFFVRMLREDGEEDVAAVSEDEEVETASLRMPGVGREWSVESLDKSEKDIKQQMNNSGTLSRPKSGVKKAPKMSKEISMKKIE